MSCPAVWGSSSMTRIRRRPAAMRAQTSHHRLRDRHPITPRETRPRHHFQCTPESGLPQSQPLPARSVADPNPAPMPAPARPHTPDHETLVITRAPRADEGETVMKEPVMVPERKPVVEEVAVVGDE